MGVFRVRFSAGPQEIPLKLQKLHNCVIIPRLKLFRYTFMIRSQILITNGLSEEISKLAKKQNVSKSEVVRTLLGQALNVVSKEKASSHIELDFIYPLEKYTGKNPRITGFKELYTVGANITDVFVINHSAFLFFKQNDELPHELKHQLLKIGRNLKEASLTKKLVLRRAYFVPGLDNPPGPRFLGINPENLSESLEQLYKFAIDNNYDIKEDYEIAAFIYPFADPEPLSVPIKSNKLLPYGGYAYPLNKTASRVEILSVWGNNEGVQSFDAVDRYVIDGENKIILEKNVPQKNLMLATTKTKQSTKLQVPVDKQFEQVLNDQEILETAQIVFELNKKFGSRRIEFSFDGSSKLEYNESAPYQVKRDNKITINKRGKVIKISSEKDLSKIKLNKKFSEEKIIYINKSIVENRSYDVLNTIAGLSTKFTVLYPGLSATAHAMRVLTDFGHTAIVVGNRVFKENDDLHIKTDDKGGVTVTKLDEDITSKYILNLYDAKLFNIDQVGGKAYNLSLLKTRGFNVPHGIVLTTDFFDRVLKDSNISLTDVFKKTAQIKISDQLWSKIISSGLIDKNKKYSVRSSATVEDQKDHSFAGQFDTFLNIDFHNLKPKVEKVMNSVSNESVIKYFNILNKSFNLKMAVVIQEMVDAEISGVVFGKDIQTMNQNNIIIDVANGLAEGVVDGTAQSTKVIYSRIDDEIIKMPNLEIVKITKAEINALIEMTVSIERFMNGPQDIEWSIDKSGVMWILQSRDI